jgi:hypothetical protein
LAFVPSRLRLAAAEGGGCVKKATALAALTLATLVVSPLQSASAAGATCNGITATIVGTRANNVLFGTRHPDVIQARSGNDVIYGRSRDDLICGGSGNDTIDGQKGLDTVYGGTGTDYCVAPTHREHQLHHRCEIHVTVPTPRRRPGTAESFEGAVNAATARQSAELKRIVSASRVPRGGLAGVCRPYCSAGHPSCVFEPLTGSIHLAPNGGEPLVVAVDSPGDYVTIREVIYNTFSDNLDWTDAEAYWIPDDGYAHAIYPNTTYYPNVRPSAYQVFAYFAWSADGANWGPWYFDSPDTYTQTSIGKTTLSGTCVTGYV